MRVRSVVVCAATALAMTGCSFLDTDPASESDSGSDAPADVDAMEAPALADLVASGELEPLEERLPDEPLVVEPVDRLGTYGGTWNTFLMGPDDWNGLGPLNYENLVRWTREYTGAAGVDEIEPNLADFEANDDGSEYTFTLREGTRWSDGEPFTADDIMFWYEAVFSNPTLTPTPPAHLMAGGEPVVVEKVDDYTVKFVFAAPQAFFLHDAATSGRGGDFTAFPRHYMEQFHVDHNPDVAALVAESGQADWSTLFEERATWQTNVDLPRLSAWVLTTPPNQGARAVAERNPYYWKVDPEGRQLPYLDEVAYQQVEDPEVAVLRALDGQVDMEHRGISTAANRPILAEGQEEGGYRLIDYLYDSMNIALIQLNLTHPDPVKREIFTNKDFRIGLSHAIDRQEIIDLVYNGQGEPWQTSPRSDTDFYDETLAKQFTEYDVDLANQHLDAAGFTERDGDGLRLGPDGQPIRISIETRNDAFNWVDTAELVRGYWREVGIDMKINAISNDLLNERRNNNEHDAMFQSGLGGRSPLIVPWNQVPIEEAGGYGVGWAQWYLGVPGAEEPPASVQRQFEIWDEIKTTFDADKQADLLREILAINRDEFRVIGIATAADEYSVVALEMQNVPDKMPSGNPYPNPAPYNPEQFFKDESAGTAES